MLALKKRIPTKVGPHTQGPQRKGHYSDSKRVEDVVEMREKWPICPKIVLEEARRDGAGSVGRRSAIDDLCSLMGLLQCNCSVESFN